ncbi:hypothetical protein [Bacillus pumilus]|uniref:hypothetical protein n=1 Tax=Bacillus pumilus TaxID=1408 RepID=UPI00119CCB3A|nr:hypothetical protein [Bacillus pumilus]
MSKKKIIISTTIAIAAILSVTLFFLLNNNKSNVSEKSLTIKTPETINLPISVIMKELETERILFSNDIIKNSTNNIDLNKNHGEYSLILKINNQEQEILGYADSSEKEPSIELSFNKEKDKIVVKSKVTTSLDKVEKRMEFPKNN